MVFLKAGSSSRVAIVARSGQNLIWEEVNAFFGKVRHVVEQGSSVGATLALWLDELARERQSALRDEGGAR